MSLNDRLARAPSAPATVAIGFVGVGLMMVVLAEGVRERFEALTILAVVSSVAFGVWTLTSRSRSRTTTELNLAASEQRLRFAQDVARMGTWDTDLATGAGVWSESLCDLWGVDRATPATYENFRSLLDPDDRAEVDAMVRPVEVEGG